MSKENNGGPAFPCEVEPDRIAAGAHQVSQTTAIQYGMTLRDWFAAKAMSGMCTGSPAPQKNELDYLAVRSYEMADAMLKARQ